MRSVPLRRSALVLTLTAGMVAPSAAPAGAATKASPAVARPVLVSAAVAAGGTITLTAGSSTLPVFVLSTTAKRVKGSLVLAARRKGKTVTATVPLAEPSGTYRLLACSGATCVAAARKLIVTPRLTHLLAPLRTKSTLSGSPVTATIMAADGGVLATKDPAGNSYTLTIAANVLPDDTTVTMQPITSLKGLPKGALALAGVRIEPDGLQLNGAAVLTIVARRGPAKGLLAAGYVVPDAGKGLALAPALRKGTTYTEPITHFSDHGVVGAPDLVLDAIARHAAAKASDQIAEQDAALIARDGEAGAQAVFATLETSYYNAVIQPLVADAIERGSSASATLAYQYALGVLRQEALTGKNGGEVTDKDLARLGLTRETLDYFTKLDEHDAYSQCADKHDIIGGMRKLLGVDRQQQLAGVVGGFNSGQAIADCLQFTFGFDSAVHLADPDGTLDYHLAASVPVTGALLNGLTFTGSGPITYVSYNGYLVSAPHQQGCTNETQTAEHGNASTLTVSSITFPTPETPTAPIAISFDPGDPEETTHYYESCPDEPLTSIDADVTQPGWLLYWGSFLHPAQAAHDSSGGATAPFTFTGFTAGSDGVIATKTIDLSVPASDTATVSEHTVITLTHTPKATAPLPKAPPVPPKR